MKKITVAVIGGGNRAQTYTDIMRKIAEQYQVVAVAEPVCNKREYLQRKHKIPDEMLFCSWEELLERARLPTFA